MEGFPTGDLPELESLDEASADLVGGHFLPIGPSVNLDKLKNKTPDRPAFGLVLHSEILKQLRDMFGEVSFVLRDLAFLRDGDVVAGFVVGGRLVLKDGTAEDKAHYALTVIGSCVVGSREGPVIFVVCGSVNKHVLTVLTARDIELFRRFGRDKGYEVGALRIELANLVNDVAD